MQDDCYLIAVDGWKAAPYRIMMKNKAGKETDKGWDCDLVPKALLIDHYFYDEKTAMETVQTEVENLLTLKTEMEEEHGGEEGLFSTFDKLNKATVQKRLKDIATAKPTRIKAVKETLTLAVEPEVVYGNDIAVKEEQNEAAVLEKYLGIIEELAKLSAELKEQTMQLDIRALDRYKTLTEADVKELVVNNKWLASIQRSVQTEMERINQRLTQRIKELAERYETPMPTQTAEVAALENNVNAHLQKMGFIWN